MTATELEEERESLAAEYVLGTLTAAERADAVFRLRTDPDLKRAVEAWEARLSPLNETAAPVEPPPELEDILSRRIAELGRNRGEVAQLHRQLRGWQTFSLLSGAAAAALAAFIALRPPVPGVPAAPSSQLCGGAPDGGPRTCLRRLDRSRPRGNFGQAGRGREPKREEFRTVGGWRRARKAPIPRRHRRRLENPGRAAWCGIGDRSCRCGAGDQPRARGGLTHRPANRSRAVHGKTRRDRIGSGTGTLVRKARLHWLSAAALLRGYRKRRISPVEATKAVLQQIAAKDGGINAMCLVDEEAAIKSARAAEKRWLKGSPRGQLDGVPTLVKDLILTKGWPTLRGSRTIERDQPWSEDGPSVARLREHGAVLLGKTTTPEFGWKGVTDSPLTGVTRNPWDLSKTPGGSSGGSAAAVAAGFAPLALGTDGGGSIRIPAGFTGIFGLKPSFGRVPAFPLSPFGTVAHVGPMTRSAEDAAIMMNVISQPDARDWHALGYDERDFVKALRGGIKGLRIAFSPRLGGHEVDTEVALPRSGGGGGALAPRRPGGGDRSGLGESCRYIPRVVVVGDAKSSRPPAGKQKSAARSGPRRGSPSSRRRSRSNNISMRRASVRSLGSHMRLFMQRFDLLVTPSLPIPAFEVGVLAPGRVGEGKWVDWAPFTYPFNLTQQPAASVPCGFTKAGLPVGLQIVGRMFDDWTVLRAAHAYERAHAWSERKPASAL